MSTRVNFEVIAGQRRVSEVRVHGEGGEVLSGPEWTMYGGAICDGFAPVRMRCTEDGGLWRVVLPGLKRGAMPWRWQLFLQEVSTGVEWLVAEGEVRVRERRADAVAPADDEMTELVCVLSADRTVFEVQLGDATAAAVAAAGSARESAEVADQKAKAAESSASQAGESATVADQKAKAAESSASEAFGSASQAKASETAAAKSATSAETSATNAAASAELLGDAALKSQNNTFTGKNVFNGAVSGSGTLFGWDFARMEGLISMLQGIQFKKEEFTKIFPNHKEMEVWPGLDNPLESMSSDVLPKLKYVYMYLKKGYYVGVPDLSSSSLKDLCIRCDINTQFLYLNLRAEKNLLWLPAYVGTLQSPLELSLTHNSWRPNVIIYAPKMLALRLKQHWSGSLGYDVAFIGSQVYKRLQCYNDAAYKDMPVTLHGFNSLSCVEVTLTNLGLDKASILELVNGLSAYDATTMTAVPTCALYVRPEYEGDEEIVNALLNLQTSVEEGGKGWTVAVSGISLTGAATLDLEPTVYCKKLADSAGQYIDADGERWDVSSGTVVLRHGLANEQLGYEPFESLEDALAEWGLTVWEPGGKE